ncbi:MAG: hypothetical protein RJB39_667 [Candidatus Parcubacteria bacterium]|jgi:membrane protein DedA with SNARE-associated domain
MEALVTLILTYKYLIILPLAIVEGPLLALLLGYFVHAGYVSLPITWLLLLIGDIGPDLFYYHLGKYGNRKMLESNYLAKANRTTAGIEKIKYLWHTHRIKTMFFGKLSYGISVPIIISAGLSGLPLKKFILTSLPIGIFQISVLMTVGYFLGHSYALAITYVKSAGLIFAGLIALFILVYILLIKYSARMFSKPKL